jgi:hypothetical protein
MTHTSFSAKEIHEITPLGSLIRVSDGTVEPPARHRRKHAAWEAGNATGRLVRKAPVGRPATPSFTLHLGDFGGDVTIVKAYRVFTVSSELSYTILERPRPGQVAVVEDEAGLPTLIHLADTEADAAGWLKANPHPNARIAPTDVFEPRTFTYLQDPGHGWLMVTRADLAGAGMSPADFSVCSYVSGDSLALEEDCDMPRFLKRLDERGTPYRLREEHTNGDAHVHRWVSNSGAGS